MPLWECFSTVVSLIQLAYNWMGGKWPCFDEFEIHFVNYSYEETAEHGHATSPISLYL